jgi:hypothetical protein
MLIASNLTDNLLKGLGDFWNIFLTDKELIKSEIQINEFTLAKAFFKFLRVVLQSNIQDFPPFDEDIWVPIKLKCYKDAFEIKTAHKDPFTGNFIKGYVVELDYQYNDIVDLYNRIVYPDVIYKENYDYLFRKLKLIKYNQEVTVPCLIFKDKIIENELLDKAELVDTDGNIYYEIILWASKIQLNNNDLYNQYGRFVAGFVPNTLSYKAFVEGLWYFYIKGPSINRITAAVNLIMGFPITRYSDEVIKSIVRSDLSITIATNKTEYVVPREAILQSNIVVGNTLDSFSPIVNAVYIEDYLIKPDWWNHMNLSSSDFTPSPELMPGYSPVMLKNSIPTDLTSPPNLAYEIFDKYLKWNRYNINIDLSAAVYARNVNEIIEILKSGLPIYVGMVFGASQVLQDDASLDFGNEDNILTGVEYTAIDHFWAFTPHMFIDYGVGRNYNGYVMDADDPNVLTFGEMEDLGLYFDDPKSYDTDFKGFFLNEEYHVFDDDIDYGVIDGESVFTLMDIPIDKVYMPLEHESEVFDDRNAYKRETEYPVWTSYNNAYLIDEIDPEPLHLDATAKFGEKNVIVPVFGGPIERTLKLDQKDPHTGKEYKIDDLDVGMLDTALQINATLVTHSNTSEENPIDYMDPTDHDSNNTFNLVATMSVEDDIYDGFRADIYEGTIEEVPQMLFGEEWKFMDNDLFFTDDEPTMFIDVDLLDRTFDDSTFLMDENFPFEAIDAFPKGSNIRLFGNENLTEELKLTAILNFKNEIITESDSRYKVYIEGNTLLYDEETQNVYIEEVFVKEKLKVIATDLEGVETYIDI